MRKKIGGESGCESRDEYNNCQKFVADHSIIPNGTITVSDTYSMGNIPGYSAPSIGSLNYLPSSFGQMGGNSKLILKKNKKKINIILEKLKKKYKKNIKINLKKELK